MQTLIDKGVIADNEQLYCKNDWSPAILKCHETPKVNPNDTKKQKKKQQSPRNLSRDWQMKSSRIFNMKEFFFADFSAVRDEKSLGLHLAIGHIESLVKAGL